VSEDVTLQEIIAQKDAQNRLLQAENERQSQEIKLLKQKIDLLIRRLFGSKSEKLDAAQLELLLKEDELGKADASAEKAEASPLVEALRPVVKRPDKRQRRERWPEDLAVEQEVIEPEEVKEDRSAVSEKKSPKCSTTSRRSFSDARSFAVSSCAEKKANWLR
jgi:Transposase C of IS166 homeodomain